MIEYLQTEWSDDLADSFAFNLQGKLELLYVFPFIGVTVNQDSNFRKVVITKHNLLVYRIERMEIRILRIFDTRQHPRKLKLRKR